MELLEALFVISMAFITYAIGAFGISRTSAIVGSCSPMINGGGQTFADSRPKLTKKQKEVSAEYRKYKQTKQPTFKEFCWPKEYKVQRQQKLIADLMKPTKSPKEMLVIHRIGAGKTCLAIQVGIKWQKRGKVVFVMPANLIAGAYAEMRSQCSGELFTNDAERLELSTINPNSQRYRDLLASINSRIDAVFTIVSFEKFAPSIKGVLLIIDEYNSIVNEKGVRYKAVKHWIDKNKKASVMIMSGTPFFNHASEINTFAKLLRVAPPTSGITADLIPKLFDGKVSYFEGAPSFTFPRANVMIKQVVMSAFQARHYKSEVEAEMTKTGNIKTHAISDNFYCKSRQKSNIVFPDNLANGIAKLTNTLIHNSLSTYSAKYDAIVRKLNNGKLSFVYSSFMSTGVIALARILRAHGWRDFTHDGPGRKRYALWTGEQSMREREMIRNTFNGVANDNGSQLQAIIGSSAITVGVSFVRARQALIIEPTWSAPKMEQIIGRVIRFCSHKTLPAEDREVDVIIYAAVVGAKVTKGHLAEVTPDVSIDLYLIKLAEDKKIETDEYTRAFMDIAVDRAILQ